MLLDADHIPATRIAPSQLLPDVGGRYRHRETGEVVTLGCLTSTPVARINRPNGESQWMHGDNFWQTYIHAESRPEYDTP